MTLPFYPFYWGDYSSKTFDLTQGQHGAYVLYLRHQYTSGKGIPDKQWSSIAKAMTEQEKADARYVLETYFKLRDGHWYNDRAMEIMAEANEAHEKRVNAGKKGGTAKAKNSSNATAMPEQSSSNQNQNQNHIEDTNVSSKGVVSAPEVSMNFETIWNAYPGRGKNGETGAAYKGDKKTARLKFEKIYTNTKEAERETLVRNIITACARYREFIERADYPSKHLSTWLNAAAWETDYGVSATAQANPRRGGEGYLETMYAKAMGDQTHRHLREGGGNQGSGMGVDPSDIRGSDVLVDENDGALSKG